MKINAYSIWSEDEGSWFPGFLTIDKAHAEETMKNHCKSNDCEYWLADGLIHLETATLELPDTEKKCEKNSSCKKKSFN